MFTLKNFALKGLKLESPPSDGSNQNEISLTAYHSGVSLDTDSGTDKQTHRHQDGRSKDKPNSADLQGLYEHKLFLRD